MSRLSNLIGSDYKGLIPIIAQYEEELAEAHEHLKLRGKTLQMANMENPTWQAYYDERKIELETIVAYMKAQVAAVRSKLFRRYTDTFQRDLSDTAKNKYIDNEEEFLNVHALHLEITETYNKYKSVVEMFTTRGYALNNITKAHVAAVENALIV